MGRACGVLTQANRLCTRTANCQGHESKHSRKINTCWRHVFACPRIPEDDACRTGENVRDIQLRAPSRNPIEKIESSMATVCILRNHLHVTATLNSTGTCDHVAQKQKNSTTHDDDGWTVGTCRNTLRRRVERRGDRTFNSVLHK